MEVIRGRGGMMHCSFVFIQLQVRLTIFVFWIMLVHPNTALYLDFYANNPVDRDSSDAPRNSEGHETLSWAVKIQHQSHRKSVNRTHVDFLADVIAEDLGLKNYGQVGELMGHYLFVADSYHEALNGSMHWDMVGKIRGRTEGALSRHPMIEWFNQQTIRRRFKRTVHFPDPSYKNQWHLHNTKIAGMDINVTSVWEHNITGAGVTVAVIDDGLEWTNEDIKDNYCAEGSWDLNSNDNNPMPEMRIKEGKQTQNRHGTRCAGEIAAVSNGVCGLGVAYNSKVSGIRLLDGPMTDSLEATAFNKFMYINDIYSCSWGPDDDGKTVDGPHTLAKAALQHGVTYGRRGRGSIFVVASGNGGKNGDNCNYDGYANSMYTVTIGAVDEKGQMPFYAEECSSLFAVTYSSGSRPQRNIVTTDWTLGPGTGCTNTHTGTSAAAPLAAGMISLMLEAKPCLSWRDVQHIIVYTASKIDEKKGEWFVNAAGFHHSHKHGFGVLKAWRLVNAAKVWPSVPWLTSVISPVQKAHKEIPTVQEGGQLTVDFEVSNSTAETHELLTLEHVLITVSLSHAVRGKLKIELVCPSGTRSVIGARRKKDNSRDGLRSWTFSTVRCWGEEAVGLWQLIITDYSVVGGGILEEWTLALYGSNMRPDDVEQRKAMVAESFGGEFLDTNLTEPCSFYWATPLEEEPYLSLKTIKFLLLVSAFATILALYYSLEQAFCTDDEKQKQTPNNVRDQRDTAESNEEEQNHLLAESTGMVELTSFDLQEVNADGVQQRSEVNSDVLEVDPDYACRVQAPCIGDRAEPVDKRSGGVGPDDGVLLNVQSIAASDSAVFGDGDFGASAACVDTRQTICQAPSTFTPTSQPHTSFTVLPPSNLSWSQAASNNDSGFKPHPPCERTLGQDQALLTGMRDTALIGRLNNSPEGMMNVTPKAMINVTPKAMPTSSYQPSFSTSSNNADPQQPIKLPDCTSNQINSTDNDVPPMEHTQWDTQALLLLPENCDIHSTLPTADHSFADFGGTLGDETVADDFEIQSAIEDTHVTQQTILPKPCGAALGTDAGFDDRTNPESMLYAAVSEEPTAERSDFQRRTPPFLAE